MKHEQFKVFSIDFEKPLTKEVKEFLAHTTIQPKSISIADSGHLRLPGNESFIVIGYTEGKREHDYKLSVHNLEDSYTLASEATLENELNSIASEEKGVICQDVHFDRNGKLRVIFLGHK